MWTIRWLREIVDSSSKVINVAFLRPSSSIPPKEDSTVITGIWNWSNSRPILVKTGQIYDHFILTSGLWSGDEGGGANGMFDAPTKASSEFNQGEIAMLSQAKQH